MQRKKWRIAFICYESLRLITIVTSRPEAAIMMMPLSWYAAVPLLALPLILAVMFFSRPGIELPTLYTIYALSKLMSIIGMAAYIGDDLPYAFTYGAQNGYYSLHLIIFLLIFFIIDGIIISVLYRKKLHSQTRQSDGSRNEANGDI